MYHIVGYLHGMLFLRFKQNLLKPDILTEEKFASTACTTCYAPIKAWTLPWVFYKQWQCARGDLFLVSSLVSPTYITRSYHIYKDVWICSSWTGAVGRKITSTILLVWQCTWLKMIMSWVMCQERYQLASNLHAHCFVWRGERILCTYSNWE